MLVAEGLRQKEREDELSRKRLVAQLEANSLNKKTLREHELERDHSMEAKALMNHQNNTYAP